VVQVGWEVEEGQYGKFGLEPSVLSLPWQDSSDRVVSSAVHFLWLVNFGRWR
jgi:hypothetical protein